jgi:hypothetical protein
MIVTVELPHNRKKVDVRVFNFGDIRNFLLVKDSHKKLAEFLESFIVTKGLNSIEKFIALMKLRGISFGDEVTLQGSFTVTVDYLLEDFAEITDITEVLQYEGVEITLDYPTRFCCEVNDIYSIITKVEMGDEVIHTSDISEEEFERMLSSLPPRIFNDVIGFIKRKSSNLNFYFFKNKNTNTLKETAISFLTVDPLVTLYNSFFYMTESSFREYVFLLSKRIPDVNFLLNCTLTDIEDYFKLYKMEVERENDRLKNNNG